MCIQFSRDIIFTVGWLAVYEFFHPQKLAIVTVLGSTVNLSEVRVILKNKPAKYPEKLICRKLRPLENLYIRIQQFVHTYTTICTGVYMYKNSCMCVTLVVF